MIAIGIEQPTIAQARAAAGARRAERIEGVVEDQMGVPVHKRLQLFLQVGAEAIRVAAIEARAAFLGGLGAEPLRLAELHRHATAELRRGQQQHDRRAGVGGCDLIHPFDPAAQRLAAAERQVAERVEVAGAPQGAVGEEARVEVERPAQGQHQGVAFGSVAGQGGQQRVPAPLLHQGQADGVLP